MPNNYSFYRPVLAQSTWWSIEAAFLSSVLVMAVANLTIPHIRSLDLMCGLFFANGLAGGTIQAGNREAAISACIHLPHREQDQSLESWSCGETSPRLSSKSSTSVMQSEALSAPSLARPSCSKSRTRATTRLFL